MGTIAPGEKLPTEKQISKDFQVSRSTVQTVMARLSHEGLVRRYPGRGTFACRVDDGLQRRVNLDIHNIQSFETEIAITGDQVTYKLISYSKVPATPRAAQKLRIEPGEEVSELYRLRYVSQECIGSEVRYFAPNLRLDVSVNALETQGVFLMIEDDLGLRISRIEAVLRATNASPQDASHLGIEAGAPLLVRSHTLYTDDGDVILYGESRYLEPFSFSYVATLRS